MRLKHASGSFLILMALVHVAHMKSKLRTFLHASLMALRPCHPPPWLSTRSLFALACLKKPWDENHLRRRFQSASIRCMACSLVILGVPGSFSRKRFHTMVQRSKVWVWVTANCIMSKIRFITSVPFFGLLGGVSVSLVFVGGVDWSV